MFRPRYTVVSSQEVEPLAQFIWRSRYRAADTIPPELTIADTWDRVARTVAGVESNPRYWEESFRSLLDEFRFLPAGRILAGAGVPRDVTLSNCFVMGPIDDSINGIFEALKEGALTMQHGGGVGYDFSTLRPRGSRAQTTGAVASGPVSFLQVWDATCATILSTGARRGAMMATLRCDHPDIEGFIEAKQVPGTLTRFNLSVLITDAFMAAVDADAPWPLVFPSSVDPPGGHHGRIERGWNSPTQPIAYNVWRIIGARALWKRLCQCAHDSSEPGVLFIDHINTENNLGYAEQLSATNPCAEEPLPPYGSCNLGSLNLVAFVRAPFTSGARLDHDAICEATQLAVRFLDNVIDISHYPLARQRQEAHATRRIGLGVTGLADALAMLGLRYDSSAAREVASTLMRTIRDAAYVASVELARERGPFKRFDRELYLDRPFIRRLPKAIRAGIDRHGIRGSHLLAVAPTGAISLLADNVSSGIEPIFHLRGERCVLDLEATPRTFPVTDRAYAMWRSLKPDAQRLPGAFIEIDSISPQDQLLMQAALQPFVDGGISKTVALASDISTTDVEQLYQTAFALDLKGCTVFRSDASRASPANPLPNTASSLGCRCDTEGGAG